MQNAIVRLIVAVCLLTLVAPSGAADKTKPLKAMLITGGCCHDYVKQIEIITKGVSARANVVWTVKHFKNIKRGEAPEMFYDKDFAKGYDVIVHNECWAHFKNDIVIEQFVQAHHDAGAAVVAIHCAMHTFRDAKTKEWDNLLGVESRRHGAKFKIFVKINKSEHPVMATVPKDWVTRNGELYHTKLLPSAVALGTGSKDGTSAGQQVCVWTNEYKGTRAFCTTLGHHNETMTDPVYMDMLTRGVLWACKKLDDKGKPMPGYGPTKAAE